jgi:cytochrome c biogenesis protein CcmG, thiol:disulfide interchange protein DsbE
MSPSSKSSAPSTRRWVAFLPLILFGALVLVFVFRLFSGDPSKLPSALIGKPVPVFSLPALDGLLRDGKVVPGFAQGDLAQGSLTSEGKVILVNVFASWCAPCHQEHPLLMELAKDPRITLLGINYKDKPENARRFLGRLGNPYAAVGVDEDGRTAIDWGVYGVPETFLITRTGIIAFKHVGPITPDSLARSLEPAIQKALK